MKPIFIAATGQNAGKTTASIGLVNLFYEKGISSGFIKPVGQQYVRIDDVKVDKDSVLMNVVFDIRDDLQKMSPIAIPRGFTTEYVKHREEYAHLETDIKEAFNHVSQNKDTVIIEGTGHSGVGSIFGLCNAKVAQMLGASAIIVAEGGIGRAIDEIVLNAALLEKYGVDILGVIINKVREEKYDKIKSIVSDDLTHKGLRPLGFLPHRHLLTLPHIYQIRNELNAEVLCGEENVNDYVENIVIAAMEPQNTMKYLANRSLVITPGDRIDNILVAITSHMVQGSELADDVEGVQIAGILLTGGFLPHHRIMTLLKKSNIPVLLSQEDTYSVASKVYSMTIKTQTKDVSKIDMIKELFENYIDTDFLFNYIGKGGAG